MSARSDRVSQMRDTAKDYIKSEKTRIENEVSVLEAVLKGRTGGAGVQEGSIATVVQKAQQSLADFLKG